MNRTMTVEERVYAEVVFGSVERAHEVEIAADKRVSEAIQGLMAEFNLPLVVASASIAASLKTFESDNHAKLYAQAEGIKDRYITALAAAQPEITTEETEKQDE